MISPASKTQIGVRPRVKIWLEAGGESVLCRGLCDILKAVHETGSIKDAAAKVGRSYRFVWSRIKEAEQSLDSSLVETRIGGREANRSELTPLALDLVSQFDLVCQQVYHLIDDVFARQLKATFDRHRPKKAKRSV